MLQQTLIKQCDCEETQLLLSWKLFYGKEEMLEQQEQRKMMKMQTSYNNDHEKRYK